VSSRNELGDIANRVYLKALRAAEKALKEPGEEGYDGTGETPWKERSVRVAAGLMLAAKALDHNRETDVGHRQFGLLLMRERFKSVKDWEAHAAEVDGAKAITVPALPPKEE